VLIFPQFQGEHQKNTLGQPPATFTILLGWPLNLPLEGEKNKQKGHAFVLKKDNPLRWFYGFNMKIQDRCGRLPNRGGNPKNPKEIKPYQVPGKPVAVNFQQLYP